MAAGYIGAADITLGGDFSLGKGAGGADTVAQLDNHGLAGLQAFIHAFPDFDAGVSGVQVFQHIVIDTDHIHE